MNTKQEKAVQESSKTTGRVGVIGALAVLVTYLIKQYFPDTPEVVVGAILTLIGVAYDSYIHHAGGKLKIPW